ncbi:hypothetical protein [Paenibacillus sp. EKM211P]|uniref:hypothetical protein n=1 Tax=Paenibacillus sp. EKM211P TaxID=1683679 RepID=UPI0013E97391|nr:hypothetical protein [Paenibacillus sp. EKM211P]KAF6584864.1 hypothetical protein G9G57_06805 [Paenibacillus sp. EKM211P]
MLYAYADLNNRIYAVLEAAASPDHEHTILVSSRDVLGKNIIQKLMNLKIYRY